MSQKKTSQTPQEYLNKMHRFSRIYAVIIFIAMIMMPIIAGLYFKSMPSIGQVFAASAGILAIFVPISISEAISYTPILGSSIYLTMITGNTTNLKMPAVNNSLQLLDIPYGSEDADIISSITVCISSFVTIIIIATGVLMMVPLQPILSHPSVKTATLYIMPALFGAMSLGIFNSNLGGGVKVKGRMLGTVITFSIVLIVSIADIYILKTGMLSVLQGFLILAMLPVTFLFTKYLYKKGKIEVILPTE